MPIWEQELVYLANSLTRISILFKPIKKNFGKNRENTDEAGQVKENLVPYLVSGQENDERVTSNPDRSKHPGIPTVRSARRRVVVKQRYAPTRDPEHLRDGGKQTACSSNRSPNNDE
jgi:hypothetical protein